MKVFDVHDDGMSLVDFVVGRFSYYRDEKNIGPTVEAVQVTPENIGMLALEFEAELFYTASGDPYFSIFVARLTEGNGPRTAARLTLHPSEWLIPLRGEFHVFRHYQFIHTFVPVGPMTFHPMRDDVVRPMSTDPGDENFDGVTYMQEQLAKPQSVSAELVPESVNLRYGDIVRYKGQSTAEVETTVSDEGLVHIRFADTGEVAVVATSSLELVQRARD